MSASVLAGTPAATGYFGFGLGLSDSCSAEAARTLTLGVADFADLAKANAKLPVTFTSATGLLPVLRFVELTAGSELSFSVAPKVKGDLPVEVKLYDAAGREFDLSGASTLRKGKLTVRRFAVSLTGRYFLAFRPLLAFDGEVTLQPSASSRSKWAGTVTTDAAGTPQTAKFSALPGSKVAITVRAAKGSAAIPTITSLKDGAGNELFVGTELKLTKWGATLKPKLALTGGDFTLTIVPRENSSGAVSWSAGLKPPKSYAFTLLE